jgi:hypothetical protein
MQHLRCLQTPYLYQDGLLYSRLFLRLVFGCHAAAGAERRCGPQGITRKTVPLPYPPMAGERAAQRRRRAHALRATVAGALAAMAMSRAAPVVCWGVGAGRPNRRRRRTGKGRWTEAAVAPRFAAALPRRRRRPNGPAAPAPPAAEVPKNRRRTLPGGGGSRTMAAGANPKARPRSRGVPPPPGRLRRWPGVRLGCRPSGGRYFQPHAGRRYFASIRIPKEKGWGGPPGPPEPHPPFWTAIGRRRPAALVAIMVSGRSSMTTTRAGKVLRGPSD